MQTRLGGRAATLLGIVLLHAAFIAGLLVLPSPMPHHAALPVETFLTLIAARPPAPPAPTTVPASTQATITAPIRTGLPAPVRTKQHPPSRNAISDPCPTIAATDPKSPDYRPDCGRPAHADALPLDLPGGFHLDDLGRINANSPSILPGTPQDAAAVDALAARRLTALRAAFGPADRLVDRSTIDRLPMIATEKWQQAEKWNDEFLQRSEFLQPQPH